MLSVMIIINKDVRNKGIPGMDFVVENLADEIIGKVKV